jgi:hypothetical protein
VCKQVAAAEQAGRVTDYDREDHQEGRHYRLRFVCGRPLNAAHPSRRVNVIARWETVQGKIEHGSTCQSSDAMPPGEVGWLWRHYAETETRNGLQPSMVSMFATPVALRAINGSSTGAEHAFRHSPHRNVRARRELLGITRL